MLVDRLPPEEIASYIDGLVTGAELLDVREEWPIAELPIGILGAGTSADTYRESLAMLGYLVTPTAPSIGPILARIHAQLAGTNV